MLGHFIQGSVFSRSELKVLDLFCQTWLTNNDIQGLLFIYTCLFKTTCIILITCIQWNLLITVYVTWVTWYHLSMTWCKTAVSPLLMHWRYHSLALNHRYSTTMDTDQSEQKKDNQYFRRAMEFLLCKIESVKRLFNCKWISHKHTFIQDYMYSFHHSPNSF